MATQPEPAQGENTYFLDAESATEMARLTHQDRLLTGNIGGIFPEQPDLTDVGDILDVGCGPGGWVLDVAQKYPKKRAVGCDVSRTMIEYARAQAWSQGLENATFRVLNALQGLDFPDESFDLVNARLVGGFLPRAAWPRLIQECRRITRPSGVLRLTECEASHTTSPACSKLTHLFTRALHLSGMSFSADGSDIGITPMLARFLRDAGYQAIGRMAHVVDYSAGEGAHASTYQDMMVASKLMQPFLVKMGVATNEEVDQVYQQSLIEMMMDDFCATWFFLTVWGHKP